MGGFQPDLLSINASTGTILRKVRTEWAACDPPPPLATRPRKLTTTPSPTTGTQSLTCIFRATFQPHLLRVR